MYIKSISLSAITLILSTSVNAALISESFTVTVLQGDFIDTIGTGSFTYDDTLITGIGSEIISPADGLSIEFNVFGQEFTESNDVDYPGFPELAFLDGNVLSLDFFVVDTAACFGCSNPTEIIQEGVNEFGIFDLNPVAGGGFEGELSVNAVPVPAAVWLFGSGLIGLIGVARRKKA